MSKALEVLNQILEKTRQGKIPWESTELSHQFLATVHDEDGTLVFQIYAPPVDLIGLRIESEEGEELFHVNSSILPEDGERALEELYTTIQSQLKVGVSRVLEALNRL